MKRKGIKKQSTIFLKILFPLTTHRSSGKTKDKESKVQNNTEQVMIVNEIHVILETVPFLISLEYITPCGDPASNDVLKAH